MGYLQPRHSGSDKSPLLNGISMAQYTLVVFTVSLRLVTRGCVVKRFGVDDAFITLASILGAAQTATIFLQNNFGRGRHAFELEVEEFNEMLKYNMANMLIYFVANWAVKMSILALYHRIGSSNQGLPWIVQPRVTLGMASLLTAFHFSAFVAQLCACTPIANAWNIEARPRGCFNGAAFMQSSATINVLTDVTLLLLPLPLLLVMKFNKKQRTALAFTLSIGLFPVVASTMRLCEIVMAGSITAEGKSWRETDSSWKWAWVPVWSLIEVGMGTIAASLPCLSPLVRLLWARFSGEKGPHSSDVPTLLKYGGDWTKVSQESQKDHLIQKPRNIAIADRYNVLLDEEQGAAFSRAIEDPLLHSVPPVR